MGRLGLWALAVLAVMQGSCAPDREPAPAGTGTPPRVETARQGVGELGAACPSDAECLSGHCADGVCCDIECGGTDPDDCQACSVAAGAASDGICALVAGGTVCRPAAGECDYPEVCTGDFELCPGDFHKAATELCQDTTCDPGLNTMTLPTYCDGASVTCPVPSTMDCGSFGCGATACSFRCAGDSICPAGFYCPYVEICVPKQANGTECWKEPQCVSGFCVDGVCCNAPCGDSNPNDCQSCGLPASPGVCSPVPAGTTCRPLLRACDVAETCTGSTSACAPDLRALDGTPCFRGVCESAACQVSLLDAGADAADAADAARDASLADATRDASSSDASRDAADADATETGTLPPLPDTGLPDTGSPSPDASGAGGTDGGGQIGNGGAVAASGGAPSEAGTGAGGALPVDASGAGGAPADAGSGGAGGTPLGTGGAGAGGAGAGGDGSGGALGAGGAGAGGDGSGGTPAGSGGAGAGGDGSGGALPGAGGAGAGGDASGGTPGAGGAVASAGGALPGSGGAGAGGVSSGGARANGGTGPGGASAGGARSAGGTTSAGGSALPDGGDSNGQEHDEGTCGCRVVARRNPGGAQGLALLLLASALLRRRRA